MKNEKLDSLIKDGVIVYYEILEGEVKIFFPKGQILNISTQTIDSLHFKSDIIIK